MMRILIATTLLAGCIDEDANIGVSSEPVTCQPTAAAEAHGHIESFTFGTATARLGTGTPTQVDIADNQLILQLGFQCGTPARDTYAVMPVQPQMIDCPLAVTGSVVGQVEFVDANSGTLIVDETQSCLAGRFAIDFGASGSLAGWFSVPWQ